MNALQILHYDATDTIVIADATSNDDIAEVFHSELHTVAQTAEQALATARTFVAAGPAIAALRLMQLVRPDNWADADDPAMVLAWNAVDAALALVDGTGEAA